MHRSSRRAGGRSRTSPPRSDRPLAHLRPRTVGAFLMPQGGTLLSQYVKVYTVVDCQGCRATKRWLDKNGIDYELIDVRESPTLVDQIKAVAERLHVEAHMPFVEVHTDISAEPVQWFDFRPDLLAQHAATSTAA